jgi:hypothetical protein
VRRWIAGNLLPRDPEVVERISYGEGNCNRKNSRGAPEGATMKRSRPLLVVEMAFVSGCQIG